MNPSSLAQLLAYVQSLAPVPDVEAHSFLESVKLETYSRGSFFTKVGDSHDRVGIVLRGVFRVFYTSLDGELHVRNFCKEGMPVGSYATILQRQPAHVTIEALEDSVVAQFRYQALEDRFERHAAWERLGRRLAEEHYISREKREYHLLALDAAARYKGFLEDFPGFANRITQVNIASYIGVKPETLSRLLKRQRT